MNRISISLYNARSAFLPMLLAVCLFASAVQAMSGNLLDVRVGTHRMHDRLVMELDQQVKYTIIDDVPDKITVRLYSTAASRTFTLPQLKKNLAFIEGVEAYLIGSTDLEIDIALTKQSDYKVLVLDGTPWRLVLDISAKEVMPPVDASKPVQHEEPEYVPGDKPIETRYADLPAESETKAGDEPTITAETVVDPSETTPELAATIDFSDSLPLIPENPQSEITHVETEASAPDETTPEQLDNHRINSVLHRYYLAIGDTESALAFGEIGSFDDDVNNAHNAETGISVTLAALVYRMPWLILGAALLTGVLGGLLAYWIGTRFLSGAIPKRTPKPKKVKAVAPPPDPAAEELEKDLDTLDSAVDQEPKMEKVEEPVPEPEPVMEAEAGGAEAPVDEEVKETAMERRVKRVLELSKGGADIESIAKQLEMSQDEVKLILDLN